MGWRADVVELDELAKMMQTRCEVGTNTPSITTTSDIQQRRIELVQWHLVRLIYTVNYGRRRDGYMNVLAQPGPEDDFV